MVKSTGTRRREAKGGIEGVGSCHSNRTAGETGLCKECSEVVEEGTQRAQEKGST